MSLNANAQPQAGQTKRVKQDEIAIGNYMARIVQVLDTGIKFKDKWDTATNSYVPDRDKGMIQHIMVTYELLTEFVKDEDGKDVEDKPRWISEEFPLYHLGQDLATSTKRYLAIDPTQEYEGDWTRMVGVPCQVAIVHKKSGKAKVGSVAGAIKGVPYPELKNEGKLFTMDMGDCDVLQSLPDWVQEKIKGASNFPVGAGQVSAPAQEPTQEPTKVTATPSTSGEPPFDTDVDNNSPY